jgi:hypothetical protein
VKEIIINIIMNELDDRTTQSREVDYDMTPELEGLNHLITCVDKELPLEYSDYEWIMELIINKSHE